MSKWSAQVNIKWNNANAETQNWEWLKEWKEVKWAASTMGEWDATLWVDIQDPAKLEEFVHTKLRSKNWIQDTKSTWIKEVWAA